jgi:tellurite resistance protein TehA-like permease
MHTLNPQALTDKKKENLFSAIYIGSVFIIIALVYYIHISDNLLDGLINFFTSLTLAPVPSIGISLPAPVNPAAHMNLYTAAFQLSIGIGILEIVILMLRVGLHSPVSRKAETIENIVFWLGASYLITTYLMNMTIQSEWFVFWAGIILIFGLALVARAFVLLAKR